MKYPRDKRTERQIAIYNKYKIAQTAPRELPPAHFQDQNSSYDPIYELFLDKNPHVERIK